ncbi:MAG: N-acetylmuramoyl-L-alanine amidase [Vicinamibacterales bacterium]
MWFFPVRMQAWRLSAIVGAVCLLIAGTPPVASAQSAADQYQRLLLREKTVRTAAVPTIQTLKSVAAGYEGIVRRYPTSAYADNALWQAAGIWQLVFERTGITRDRDHAAQLLATLTQQYPTSSLTKQAEARARMLTARTGTAPTAPKQPSVAPGATSEPGRSIGDVIVDRVAASGPLAELRAVSYTKLPKGDRLILEFSQETTFAASRTARPDQLQVTFSTANATAQQLASAASVRGTLIRSVRVAAKPASAVQVTLDLTGSPRFSTFPLYDPYRLVIDVEGDAPGGASTALITAPAAQVAATVAAVERRRSPITPPTPAQTAARATEPNVTSFREGDASTKPAPAESTSTGTYSLARQLGLGVSRIVIDPGHGGHDPGAQANGVSEAELVLDIALRAEKLLKDQPGFEVVLTRRSDQFIALEERTAIANREAADLFLSIHANASPHVDTRGIETYFLSFAMNPQAEAVAARENASTSQTMRTLPNIVKAIAMNNKLTESRELAGMVQTSLLRRLKVQNQNARDLGVKQAPFVVLIGAQMPSVLAEISFLTNRSEASLLKQPAYRQRIAQALADAVLKYQASLKKVTTLAARSGER